jgi:hypothetical protein
MAKRKAAVPKLAKPWKLELRKGGESGWITNEKTWKAQSFICYDDGTAAYDRPEALPKRIRDRMRTYCKRKMK